MSVHTVINALKDNDKKKFFELRNAMRRAYLISMNKTIGIDKYGLEDDIQMDAIDSTIAGLMQRAGMGDEPEIVGTKELKQLENALIDADPKYKPWGAK